MQLEALLIRQMIFGLEPLLPLTLALSHRRGNNHFGSLLLREKGWGGLRPATRGGQFISAFNNAQLEKMTLKKTPGLRRVLTVA